MRIIERPKGHNVIGTKWVFRNKQDQDGIVVRNKARFVAQGYIQVEGLDFGETYAPVARLEAIRILLAYACAHNIKLYQMGVKSAFLNGYINGQSDGATGALYRKDRVSQSAPDAGLN